MPMMTVLFLSIGYSSKVTAVRMPSASHGEELLYAYHCEDRDHGD